MKHEIWYSKQKDKIELCLAGVYGEEKRMTLPSDSKVIHQFYAKSEYEAMKSFYNYLGIGKYKERSSKERIPYIRRLSDENHKKIN